MVYMNMFILRGAKIALNIAYAPIKAFSGRKQGKITLISSQDDTPSRDIRMLASALEETDKDNALEIVVLAGRMRRSFAGAFKFAGQLLRELRHIATSEVVVLEGYTVSVGALKHKPGLTIIQIWHAPDAIKKFSRQILDTPAGHSSKFADTLGMHYNYNYLLCPSLAVAPAFCEAFGVSESKLVYMGMPRIDYLAGLRTSDEGRQTNKTILEKYPLLNQKPPIVYAPTFRDGRPVDIDDLVKSFDFDRFALIIKLHPLYPQEILPEWQNKEGLIFEKSFTTDEWLTAASAVITDYSGVAVEAAVCNIPTYFYVYDIDLYMEERGLNFDLREEAIAPYVFTDGKTLASALDPDNYDLSLLKTFRQHMITCPDTGNTEKLAAFVQSFTNVK